MIRISLWIILTVIFRIGGIVLLATAAWMSIIGKDLELTAIAALLGFAGIMLGIAMSPRADAYVAAMREGLRKR